MLQLTLHPRSLAPQQLNGMQRRPQLPLQGGTAIEHALKVEFGGPATVGIRKGPARLAAAGHGRRGEGHAAGELAGDAAGDEAQGGLGVLAALARGGGALEDGLVGDGEDGGGGRDGGAREGGPLGGDGRGADAAGLRGDVEVRLWRRRGGVVVGVRGGCGLTGATTTTFRFRGGFLLFLVRFLVLFLASRSPRPGLLVFLSCRVPPP